MTSTAVGVVAAGRNAQGGSDRPTRASNCAAQRRCPGARPLAHRCATHLGRTRSARWRRLPGASRRLSTAVLAANGGLATTRKGRRGRRRSRTSTRTIRAASPKRWCNTDARPWWSSTATTRAPTSTSAAVIDPVPAPRSTTRSPVPTPASRTSRCDHRSSRRCHPQRASPEAGTAHRQHGHSPSITSCAASQQANCRYQRKPSRKSPTSPTVERGLSPAAR
jgi:hypothetical protein